MALYTDRERGYKIFCSGTPRQLHDIGAGAEDVERYLALRAAGRMVALCLAQRALMSPARAPLGHGLERARGRAMADDAAQAACQVLGAVGHVRLALNRRLVRRALDMRVDIASRRRTGENGLRGTDKARVGQRTGLLVLVGADPLQHIGGFASVRHLVSWSLAVPSGVLHEVAAEERLAMGATPEGGTLVAARVIVMRHARELGHVADRSLVGRLLDSSDTR